VIRGGVRAVLLHSYGPPENLQLQEVPDPALERPHDVLVEVRAASINPIDWKIRAGLQRGLLRLKLPWTLGLDVAGRVLAVGSAVTRFAVGDEVMGCPDFRRPGSYAEKCLLEEGLLVHKPGNLSFEEAAALPLVGLTAWQCLLPRLQERPGQRVLVQAGSGGVGHIAIQLAKRPWTAGERAWVATTCSEQNRTFVESLGADRVVDYHKERWWEVLPELDVILDAVGGEEREIALRHLQRGGRLASIVSGIPQNTEAYGPTLGTLATGLGVASLWVRGKLRGVQAVTVLKQTHTAQLEALVKLAAEGELRVHIDRTFPLEQAAQAHAYGETGRIRGKVVLVP
jgi:NADPH:quinone reductase-like Zn-dependent oxidoreductase